MCDYLLFISHDGKGIIGITWVILKEVYLIFFFFLLDWAQLKKVDKKRSSEDHSKGFFGSI